MLRFLTRPCPHCGEDFAAADFKRHSRECGMTATPLTAPTRGAVPPPDLHRAKRARRNPVPVPRRLRRRGRGRPARGSLYSLVSRRQSQPWPRSRQRNCAQQLMSRYTPGPVALLLEPSNMPQPKAQAVVTCVSFDRLGVLLATTDVKGQLTLYDFDEYYACRRRTSNGAGARPSTLAPMAHIDTKRDLEVVRWNPGNDDELACAFFTSHRVCVYDLATYRGGPPKATLSPGPGLRARGGTADLTYVSASELVAVDPGGTVRLWDVRAGNQPRWALAAFSGFGTRGGDGLAAPEGAYRSRVHSNGPSSAPSLCVSGATLHCAHGSCLASWDIRKLRVPTFGAAPQPTSVRKRHMADLFGDVLVHGVLGMHVNPAKATELVLHLRRGWVAAIDTSLPLGGAVTRLQNVHVANTGEGRAQGRAGSAAVATAAAAAAPAGLLQQHRHCSTFAPGSFGDLFCVGCPTAAGPNTVAGQHGSIAVLDLSPWGHSKGRLRKLGVARAGAGASMPSVASVVDGGAPVLCPSFVQVPLRRPPSALAVHPSMDLVAALDDGSICVLEPRQKNAMNGGVNDDEDDAGKQEASAGGMFLPASVES